ncbi:MAG: hypothetical protein KAW86_08480 [Bacteroidales bacterium]|nr:hypothetical protein [Bacteroidales bacterium]
MNKITLTLVALILAANRQVNKACSIVDFLVKEALDWLENSIYKGVINYPFFSYYLHWFENICKEERFKKLMELV